MPFPELNLSTGGYEQKNKLIRENAQIARPANTSNYTTVDASYDQNGVIQDYLSMVKFGFAGFAVGSGGSVGKDSIIQQAAALAGGRTADTKLRFTMIWGHRLVIANRIAISTHTFLSLAKVGHSEIRDIYLT